LAEAIALYAANFGGNNAGGSTVSAVQALSNVSSINGLISAEDNTPSGWSFNIWTAAPTPSGHALLNFQNALIYEISDSTTSQRSAVL
jgi:hypothetical protein